MQSKTGLQNLLENIVFYIKAFGIIVHKKSVFLFLRFTRSICNQQRHHDILKKSLSQDYIGFYFVHLWIESERVSNTQTSKHSTWSMSSTAMIINLENVVQRCPFPRSVEFVMNPKIRSSNLYGWGIFCPKHKLWLYLKNIYLSVVENKCCCPCIISTQMFTLATKIKYFLV